MSKSQNVHYNGKIYTTYLVTSLEIKKEGKMAKLKFVIRNDNETWSWRLIQDGQVLLENSGFHSEKMCRNNINQVKKVTRFTKVELLGGEENE
jgi:uncharacterized protein YegP (UPF0339 family)